MEIPRSIYDELMERARQPVTNPRSAPAPYALGAARGTVVVAESDGRASADVTVQLRFEVLDDDWVLVPVLPPGTSIDQVTVGGQPVELIPTPDGLGLGVKGAAHYDLQLRYRVDAVGSTAGWVLPVPVPRAASLALDATLPGRGLDVSVVPAAGVRVQPNGGSTRVTATVPTTSSVQIAWQLPTEGGWALSRASYAGRLAGEAVAWTGTFDLELWSSETVLLELFPRDVTLASLELDGEPAAIVVSDGGRFATPVKGQGRHRVVAGFEVPVRREGGPPGVAFPVPRVPVSRFELRLPGRKEVTVEPGANVSSRPGDGGSTVAEVHVPLTDRVAFTWSEAVPEDVGVELRANASLYHAVHAEEGVLFARALVLFEVTRGETSTVAISAPVGVQLNRIAARDAIVVDWRIESGEDGQAATVFLDRQIDGELLLEVEYDQSLGEGVVPVPLLGAPTAHRRRGMVALLAGRELTLEPVGDGGATRVGENQLPAFVHETIERTVAHTFKYVEAAPVITVRAAAPERRQGRFDARIDTLVSLGEVTLKGVASIEVDVKSGRLMELALGLPDGVNLLALSGPSLREHRLDEEADGQRVLVSFTQEMEGQFRLEVTYERLLESGEARVTVPTVSIEGAEVAQGRIAVEALTAVEVQAAETERLSNVDLAELPRQLVLRTTNPILMAFKYVQADPPARLVLEVTRHRLLDVLEAAIDEARYQTLFTTDGLRVTTARFLVRNSREQFLRVALPEGAEVWSAAVDGRAEKPAVEEGEVGVMVLIKIINSVEGFPVELVYATNEDPIRGIGAVREALPRPDILVTQTRWDLYLPTDVAYGEPATNLQVTDAGTPVTGDEIRADRAALEERSVAEPIRIEVPASGVRISLGKLYANQGEEEAWFRVPYASGAGAVVGRGLALFGTLVLWGGVWFLAFAGAGSRRTGLGLLGAGVALLVLTLGFWRVSTSGAIWLSVLAALGLLLLRLRRQRVDPRPW